MRRIFESSATFLNEKFFAAFYAQFLKMLNMLKKKTVTYSTEKLNTVPLFPLQIFLNFWLSLPRSTFCNDFTALFFAFLHKPRCYKQNPVPKEGLLVQLLAVYNINNGTQ
jgi:hypothetical protein